MTVEALNNNFSLAKCDKKHPDYLLHLNKLAQVHYHLNDFAGAEQLYTQALEYLAEYYGVKHLSYAEGLDNLAKLHMQSRAYKHAEVLYQQALTIRKNNLGEQHSDYAHSLNNLAGLFYQQGNTKGAEKFYKQAIEIWRDSHGKEHPHYATAVNNQAWNQLASGNHEKALELFEHSLQQREKIHGDDGHHDIANTLTGLAHAHHKAGRPEQSEALLRRALPLLHHDSHQDLRWQVQHHFSQSLAAQGHTGAAILFAKHTLENLHGLRHQVGKIETDSHKVFLNDKTAVYTEIVELLLQQGRTNESHQVMRMLREEEFFDYIHRDKHVQKNSGIKLGKKSEVKHTAEPVYAPHEEEWVDRYDKINQQLADINQTRGLLKKNSQTPSSLSHKAKIKEIEKNHLSTHQAFDDFFDDLKINFPEHEELEKEDLIHLHQLQDGLAKVGHGAIFIHYLLGKKQLHIIITTPKTQISRQVDVSKEVLENEIRAYRQATQNITKLPHKEALALYRHLIDPIKEDLTAVGAKTLMLSTDGLLRYIPFSALYDGEKYLIEHYAVTRHNEVVDDLGHSLKEDHLNFTGFGLTQQIAGFNALPAVETELIEINKLIPGEVHFDNKFNNNSLQQALKAKRPLLHIASHFVLEPGTERDSYLLLGNGQRLTLADVRKSYDFSDINLLTLSACNTAMGSQAKGQEVEGLATLARHKGAHSVLASLWHVSDAGTGALMQRLYHIRDKEKLTKAEGLRQVQMAFIKGEGDLIRFSHPFYWAPFVLMGDWL